MANEEKGGFLVKKDGEEHLPTRVNGKLDAGLLGAAHAALFHTFRGKSYEGPGKEEAKAKLRELYKEAGLEWPGEGNSEAALQFTVSLGEIPSDGLVRLPVAITGKWTHPATRQNVELSLDDLNRIIANFENKANGEINVDYDHASAIPNFTGGPRPSAGRLLSIEPPQEFTDRGGVRRHILYAGYEPTDLARKLIQNREYRYVSPVLDPKRISKETGRDQGMTMTTVALTNTPVMEEMPEVRCSDGSVELIDAGSVHVDSTDSSGSKSKKPPSAAQEAKSMKKFSIKKLADGEHKGKMGCYDDSGTMVGLAEIEPDADDLQEKKNAEEQFAQMLTDVGFEGSTAEQVKEMLAAGARAQEAEKKNSSRSLLLSECIVGVGLDEDKAANFLADGKLNKADYNAAREGMRRVRKCMDPNNCRLLPRHGGAALKLFLADADLFKALIEEGKPVINLKPSGAQRGPTGDVKTDFVEMARARAAEKKIEFSVALSEVSREHPDMARAYREAVAEKG